ncbi:MAG: hypothetical protein PWP23_1519 [Candidatus Sumerlaeota bacterium]|nr:hypothetical protein [Candidatus Sumerlaeota bacterium]
MASSLADSHGRAALLHNGLMIPAAPLALTAEGAFSPRHQRALMRYYAAAGCGGVAVGVHTTQFAIRDEKVGLLRPVLEVCAQELAACEARHGRPILRVAGVCGLTPQAVEEARLAASLGYDAVLLSLGAWHSAEEPDMLEHCRTIAAILPLIGFYLQPAVGGRVLSAAFWREFAGIDNVVAIKIAPFNRYQTIDVVRGVALAGAQDRVTLYTGNDDNIIADMLTPFPVHVPGTGPVEMRIRGGLLGQFSVHARTFVRLMETIRELCQGDVVPAELLRRNVELTEANAVLFDAANGFRGCIPGINEVLRRRGLLPSNRCLDPTEVLSPGQAEELTRVEQDYPWLSDAPFIREHLQEWLDE